MFRPYVHMHSQTHIPLTKTSEKKVKASAFHCIPTPNITSPQTHETSHEKKTAAFSHWKISLPSNFSQTGQNCLSRSLPG